MTTEEKAKAYEEALERAQKATRAGSDVAMDIVQYIFPNLTESDDERIRKDIINLIYWLAGNPSLCSRYYRDRYDGMLAWLEKQKDASKAIEAVEKIDKYIDEHVENAHDMKDSNPDKKYYRGWDDALGKMSGILQDVYSNEKQKEPHYTKRNALFDKCVENCDPAVMKKVSDEVDEMLEKEQKSNFVPKVIRPKFAVGDTVCRNMWSNHTIREIYIDCNDPVYVCVNEEGTESHISFSEQDEWERKEQKPVKWNEEDEEIIYSLRSFLIQAQQSGGYGSIQIAQIEKCLNWLKSLPLNLKKKNEDIEKLCSNEWSEEDEKHKQWILECLADGKRKVPEFAEQYQAAFNWLKFLCPSWKPSEQEKAALRTAICVLTEERNFPKTAEQLQAILNAFDCKETRKEWKPSEEQMKALSWLLEYVNPSDKYIVLIKDLYDDLKKLM